MIVSISAYSRSWKSLNWITLILEILPRALEDPPVILTDLKKTILFYVDCELALSSARTVAVAPEVNLNYLTFLKDTKESSV